MYSKCQQPEVVEPMLEAHIKRLSHANDRLSSHYKLLLSIHDKLFGPKPEDSSTQVARPIPSGQINIINDEAGYLHNWLDRIDELAKKIEQLSL